MDSEEKVQQAKLFKEKGTNYFKIGKLQLAVKMYKKVLSFLDFEKGQFKIFAETTSYSVKTTLFYYVIDILFWLFVKTLIFLIANPFMFSILFS